MKAADSISIVEMFSEIAVAMHENRDALSGTRELEREHGRRMSEMFAAVETALAGLEPSDWSPGRYFDLAAETLLKIDRLEAKLYAAAFRRAGTVLLRRKRLGPEEFGLGFAAMASGFHDHASEHPGAPVIVEVWERAAKAYLAAEKEGLPLPGCLQAASAAAEEFAISTSQARPFAMSASLVIRAMRDALE